MLGAKLTDLFLAEKNLVDFVDKNLGQEWDRLKQNELEMDSVCHHLAGGSLDYPVMISHDFCDITTAWDIYLHAFTKDVRVVMPKKFGYGINEKPPVKNERWGKMPFRGDELTPRQFVTAVTHCGVKIRAHIVDCTMEVTQTGRLENLYPIISNVVVIRNYLWMFGELFDTEIKNKLRPEYKEFCDLVETISEQMLQVQANLLLTFIVHDEDSQEWESHHVYYEGERGSPTVQMWSYFLKSMQRDMWKIMPPQLAQRILGILVSDSLGVLVTRYTKIKPSEECIPHFVCDIINVLATVEELLCYIASDLSLLCGEEDSTVSKSIYSIHLKCQSLVASLIMIGCPLEILYKSFRRGLSSCTLLEKQYLNPSKVSAPVWMEIIRQLTPRFYPAPLSYPEWELLYTLKLLCCQPDVKWSLVYRALSMQEGKIASFILNLFPTVVAPVCDFMLEGKAFKRCGNASCLSQDCHSFAKSLPNHYASACTLYIVAHAMPRTSFVKVFRPLLLKIVDWSVMDRTQMWSSKTRPVWFQSLIDLLLPILKSCVQSLCLSVIGMSGTLPVSEQATTQFVIELLNGLTEMLSVIPRGFFLVCEEMDDMIPSNCNPIRNNVPVHFLVTALYMLLNFGHKIAYIPPTPPPVVGCSSHETSVGASSSVVQGVSAVGSAKKESAHSMELVLLSVAERLCHLDDRAFDQAIHRLVTQIESMMKQMQTSDKMEESLDTQIALRDYKMEWDLAQLKADALLQEVEGQLALRVVYWFIITHGDLLQRVITGDISANASPQQTTHSSVNSNHMPAATSVNSAGNTGANHVGHSGNSGGNAKAKNAASSTTGRKKPESRSSAVSSSYGAKINLSLIKVAPRICTYFKPVNVIHEFHYVNKYRIFDEIIWHYEENMDWVQVVRCSKLGLHKALILRHLERRWEFRLCMEDPASESTGLSPDQRSSLNKMVEEIKALMTA